MADALGSKVVVELKDWVDANKPPEGAVTEVLGAPDAPGVDLLSIIRKYELPTSFPEDVEQSAADISAAISQEELARREDFRSIFTFTIDPDDAKDFDDALSYEKHSNGIWKCMSTSRMFHTLSRPVRHWIVKLNRVEIASI